MNPITSVETGIYEIRNIHTNRSYIGQSVRFRDRWRKGYLNLLPLGKCHNEFLQHDFDKCKSVLGHENFLEFHILEVMNGSTKPERNIREEWWINQRLVSGEQLYNLNLEPTKDSKSSTKNSTEANRRRSLALKGRTLSQEHRNKLSAAKKGKPSSRLGTKWTEAQRQNMPSQKGLHRSPATEWKKGQMSGTNHPRVKTYENLSLLSPTGELITKIECLRLFAKEHGLQASNLHHLLTGKIKKHKGWTIRQIHGILVKVEP
jgi:group I intron endonuclease